VADVLKVGYDAFVSGDLKTTSDALATVLRQIPHEPNALLLAAMLGMDRGRRTLPDGTVVDGPALAQEWFERAMAVVTDAGKSWPMGWNFKSTMLFRLGRFEEAIAAAEEAIRLKPDIFESRINKANALNALGRYEEALAMYAEAGALRPSDPSVRFNRAFALLNLGRWRQGFDCYEYRWMMPEWNRDHRREFHGSVPQWWNQPLAGKRLLVHWEQGFGDTLMCLRYLPWLLAHGPDLVVLEVQRSLARLVRHRLEIDGEGLLILAHGDPVPAVDYWVSTMSLMARHGTTPETVPHGHVLTQRPESETANPDPC